ncbi:hypothetical protein Goshw_019409 [Gossypium schwendimanii]|uniref:Aminotransferase-like plant mobile domain-containing protein n=1 Tax=Gossypium schwendimanii TaxID=34291 RepID=A0A7J9KY37_GOSSC|nr:hypothetical protein [Gossypium schwendimanii]
MAIFQSLKDEDIKWRAPSMIPDEILYRCRDLDWVPLLRIWRAVGYASLLGEKYKMKVREILNIWNQTHKMKKFATNPMTTPEYNWWWSKRINDNIHSPSLENVRPIEEHLQLGLDIDGQKLEAEKMRKGKNKAKDDLNSFKNGLLETSLVNKDYWVGQNVETIVTRNPRREEYSQSLGEKVEKTGLKARVAELERSLHQHRSRNSMTELKVSRAKNKELKRKATDQTLERLNQIQKDMQDQLQALVQDQLAKLQQDMKDLIQKS